MYKFLDKQATSCVNGFFIMIVFISHLRTYMTIAPALSWMCRAFWQLMVATFLFYSGYGVMESIKKKGMDYVKNMPLRRVLGVLLIYIPAVILYGILDVILGIEFTWDQALLSLIAWKNLGNSNWYIFVILCLYIITWISFVIADRTAGIASKRGMATGLVITVLISAVYIAVLMRTTPEYYYTTISAYLFGIFFSQNKERILSICGIGRDGRIGSCKAGIRYVVMLVLSVGITIALRFYLQKDYSDYIFLLMSVFFCMGVVLTSYLVPFPDVVFLWLGEHLFEVYILMRLPMMALLRVPGWEDGGLMYAVTCLLLTVVLAWVYHKAVIHIRDRIGGVRGDVAAHHEKGVG
ncbi:MAG TPA: hypothetical protein DCP06_01575 [Lachnospiraceae bacterium]|nr:hypothetical protein [Lachnospiraceae bacterium]